MKRQRHETLTTMAADPACDIILSARDLHQPDNNLCGFPKKIAVAKRVHFGTVAHLNAKKRKGSRMNDGE